MALIITATNNFIEVALDGVVDFDSEVDLVALGLSRNAPNGLRIRSIMVVPSATGDTAIVRDGQNGPRVMPAVNMLDTWDILNKPFRDDSKADVGKVMNPYIHANEVIIAIENELYVIFEL